MGECGQNGRGAVVGKAGPGGAGAVRSTIVATLLEQGHGIEATEETGVCLLQVTGLRGEVRAHSGQVLVVQYNLAVGVELIKQVQEGFLLTVQGVDFSRSVRVV